MAKNLLVSPSLKDYIINTGSLLDALNTSGSGAASGCAILFFAGTIPATTTEVPATATVYCTVKETTGAPAFVTWALDAANHTCIKTSTEVWTGTVGTATNVTLTFFRIVMDDGDAGNDLDLTAKRLQGTIGADPANYDLYMAQPVVNTSDIKSIAAHVLSILN
jgi:hypothetical protein